MAGKFQFDFNELPRLLEHATPREAAAIEALLEHRNGPAAARAAGCSHSALSQRIATVRRRAAQRAALGAAVPPAGFVATHVTSDAKGRPTHVRSRVEQDADHFPAKPKGHLVKGVSTYLGADGSVTGQWVKTDRRKQEEWSAFEEAVRELCAEVRPLPALPESSAPADSDLFTILPWGDPHIGALAWAAECGHSWDLKIAEEQTTQVLADLIQRTPRSALFCLADLGDLFHAEDDKQATPTAGHKLDVDSRAGKIARVALRMCETAIGLALQRHDRVSFRALRGNHDPYKALMLGLTLEALYRDNPRVTIEPFENPYQFFTWGDCAFMWHHGDGSKPAQMPGIFSCDPSWGSARWRYVQTGHIHSQNRWDFPGCTVESFRTVFTGDYWSHWKGYRSGRTLDAITYSQTAGEISRLQQGPRNAP